MRILVLNWLDRANPDAGGAEEHLHEVFGRIGRSGHDVTVLASSWVNARTSEFDEGLEIHRAGGRYSYEWAAPRYYRKTLREREFDVVVEDLNKVPLFSPLWAKRPVCLLVHHLFGSVAFQEANIPLAAATWLMERPIPRIYRKNPVIAVSESTASDLAARGLARDHITVIPNGVDLEWYTIDPAIRENMEPTLLYIGRLKRYKRIDLVLQAVAGLRDRGHTVRLDIAGKGDDRARLEEVVADLRVENQVRFMGYVDERTKRDLMRRSWVHLLTSPKEGWGITNIEAAACGTPTVASDSPGLRDSVVDGETGFLVPHGDVDALVQKLEHLIENRVARNRMGLAARAYAERFTWDSAAERVLAVLDTCAGSRM